ncbi:MULTISPECIES: LytR/AlgR family response regulator transcription factor [Flavobacterium]|jgi:DNA-binding LytR/AlgR family response regulator|uniref:Two component transcriptional regulator, LytTR family n=2 Tax=Flavobacterium johnsoniae TaxID=986 RepID=A0A1M5QHJ9_FLAJO|nr:MULTISPECIES: LytTR family DNA-binding domain-containing protein [Flavobacterium]ABQ07290.1 two component transcriptional regulator, LytTR family [Flavobacterium johnsoniae UW101]OXE95652.1 DNA-binding response regulator [Flavobacterium johnsoniae UW101]WDF58020.1 LytTR family DNA-binding domain-containing protein [Flavobacterium sp. KACC 22758]WQG80875.1 LytTR family DNA-binding domain-containing protein [Flavobacterium johnsoniae UW101]SHH13577.1 two component transcriptional regulator, L
MRDPKKCIIVDDEPAAHYVLANYIKQNPKLELVFQGYNGIEAMDYLRENKVDLMFLDINMPEISGMELLKIIPNHPKTILTTAYSEFALESYDYGVIDYLLKPIYFPRFLKAIDRFFSTETTKAKEEEIAINTVNVKVDGYFIEIELDQLLFAQSFGNYVKLHTTKRTYLASITTTELEKCLPEKNFMRIHKSYIVALDKIEATEKDFVVIKNEKLPIGITYKRELTDRLKK